MTKSAYILNIKTAIKIDRVVRKGTDRTIGYMRLLHKTLINFLSIEWVTIINQASGSSIIALLLFSDQQSLVDVFLPY